MTGIDAVTAAMLVSRIDSLLEGVSAGAPAASAAQVGVPAGAPGTPTPAPLPLPATTPPAPSAQTALSNVALTLDAISRFGGDATPVVIGSVPLLTGPQIAALLMPAAADGGAAAQAQAGAGAAGAGNGAGSASGAAMAGAGNAGAQGVGNAAGSANAANGANGAANAAPVASAAANAAVAALAAALARAVSDSGLFYESHLAQWLAGQRPVADLAGEPQQQLTRDPGARTPGGGASPGSSGSASSSSASSAPAQAGGTAAGQGTHGAPAGQFGASGASAYASLAADNGTNRLLDALSNPPGAADAGATNANNAAAMATVHPATLPLVRQQLDLLATDQFRWAGEAWPGARLDWSIEPDAGGAQGDDGQLAWRTRLVLSLPSLGAVDAELVLTGSQVVARLSASNEGAARLNAHGDQLRQRLLVSGLELGGLSIRAVDSAPDAFDTFASRAAAAAYGQATAARGAPAAPAPGSRPLGDFDDIDEFGFLDDGAWL
ncbi:flagellar hook-length control protein FliK [Burkholderia sp. 22PA0106]|uniref:flagellar hook-length control protein FliK n=1 Tax=Burkholderia sp. 22PA0106 TaxID=3237371 RepID=UPI0039C1B5AA